MGAADLVPGVSGGTIAFITGIYGQLLAAISSFKKESLGHLLRGQFKAFLTTVHWRFLTILLFGLLSAILLLARLMFYLLNFHPLQTWGLFFGLILASILIIWRQLDAPYKANHLGLLFFGGFLAFWIVGLIPVETPDAWWFIFICGMIGISAMILPGISGSFLLLILGKYEFITATLKNPFIPSNALILTIFLLGVFSGLMSFSKFLNWLMSHYRSLTMAFLTGILIGSLRKVWPWKEVLETRFIAGKERIIKEINVFPQDIWQVENLMTIFFIFVGLIGVLLLENFRRR